MIDETCTTPGCEQHGPVPRCGRIITTARPVRVCGGALRVWYGTDGHNGRERFTTCERCGATS